jgi:MFS family permease
LSTTLTGVAAGLAMLVVLRLFLGLGESVSFPGSSKMIARHVPARRRGLANAGNAAAIALGPAVGTFVGGLILVNFGWRAMFVAFGLVTLLWLVPWQWAVRPLTRDRFTARSEPPFPPGRLLGQRALWAMGAGHFSVNYGMYFLLTWLPLYLVQSRGFSIEHMALLATTLYLSQAISAIAWGWWSDRLIAGGWPEHVVRKAMLAGSNFLMAVGTLGIAWADGETALVSWMIMWAVSFAMGSPTLYATAQIFAGPRAAGSWVGIQNCIGNIAGIVGPVITGMIIDRTGSYMGAFALAAAVTAAGGFCYWLAVPKIEPLGIE